ncbi:HET-domain-containing protein [Ophiobolus disseminans]|uniref:HET-domain-containing protein n=1 Tax=Ophiobolus disseminans TaxID=1469910 RepID=A0A6A7ADZ1_9PLEO|nr:HET-domain-containing protein [Ophiobolus disseminans]
MDIHTIRGWLHACEKQHGSRCMDRHHSSHPSTRLMRPRYLIDTENGCLVESSESQRYVALSYVWGGSDESACTIKSNMEGLMIPERLRRGTITIPRTILDAMHLVESLGERYLWVDRYCIVQDDSEAKPSQLASMGDIYAGAFFTIVAAQNLDASEGLYGSRRTMLLEPTATKEGEIWRDLQQPGITGDQIMLDQSIRLMRSKWFSRGWTFQENYFSRRKVIFHDDTVNWECSGASWHETQDMSVLLSQPRGDVDLRPQVATHKSSTSLNGSPWPDMIRYARLVTLFNDRDLKYPQDVFNAFAGCLHQLSSVFPGGFISSLPVMCFDAALLWQPWKPLTRRHSKAAPERDSVLPSWTWAGWAGVLHSESWRSAANYQLTNDEGSQQCSWRTFSTVCWYYSDNLTSKRQMVKVARECAQPDFTMPRKNLVQGWSYASTADGKHPKLVLHSSGPTQPFRYPIPICDPQSSPQPVVSARYLHCVTNRGFLKLGKTISRRSNRSTRCPAVELRSTFSKWAGVLRLSCRHEDVYEIVKRQNRHDRGLVELIEISAGSVKNQDIEEVSFDEWNIASCPRHNGLYEFVNVLWIEWRDGVAYRRALGRVKKSAWSRLDKERISITLG